MGRFLTWMVLLVMGVAGQQPPSIKNHAGELNGLHWRDMDKTQKTMFMTGEMAGTNAEDILRNVPPESQHRGTMGDLLRGLDNFYEVVANVPVPVWVGPRVE